MTVAPELLALTTSACIAVGMMISAPIIGRIGAVRYNATRLLAALLFLVCLAILRKPEIAVLPFTALTLLAVSSVLGIFIGDAAVYRCVNLCGVHLAALLYSVNVPLTLLLGAWIAGDVPSVAEALGTLMIIGGVMTVIYGAHRDTAASTRPAGSALITTKYSVFTFGLAIGLLGALCQSTAVLLVLPIMREGFDPLLASTFRVAIAVFAGFVFLRYQAVRKSVVPISAKDRALGSFSGILGMGIGMTTLLASLERGNAGLMSAFASMAPVLLLVVQSAIQRQWPSVFAIIGTLSVCAGILVSLVPPGLFG